MSTMITSLQHPLIKHCVRLRTQRSFRTQEEQVVIHSRKIIEELLPYSQIEFLLLSPETAPLPAKEIFYASAKILGKAAGVMQTHEMVAIMKMPPPSPLCGERILVLDRIGDPGNVGTLVRTALAFNWDRVFFTKGSCDPFNDKVLRASRGANFKLPYTIGEPKELLDWTAKQEVELLIAHLDGEDISKIDRPEKWALVIGHEGQGPQKEWDTAGQAISIPMAGEMESLNAAVAGSLLIYALSFS